MHAEGDPEQYYVTKALEIFNEVEHVLNSWLKSYWESLEYVFSGLHIL